MDEARTRVAGLLREQSVYCFGLGSPLYGGLLERAADDAESGGPVWLALEGREHDPEGSALALRFMGAVHRLVLRGDAPDLAAYYPSATGSPVTGDAWPAFRTAVADHVEELRVLVDNPVQTNEVGRAAGLIGGFLTVAKRTGLPLRILEIGASAGLLLRWDRYRYEARGLTWGPADSPVRLCSFNSEIPLPFDAEAEVAERAGCDSTPVDATSDEGRLTLLSYVWPDQIERIRNLKSALEIAALHPVPVDAANAADWLEERLSGRVEGVATVVYHSIVMQYLSDRDQDRVGSAIHEAGRTADERAPLAWLRFEPGGDVAEVRLKMWPEGADALVATSGYHGTAVRWLGA